jgi:hypothetical protein
MTKQQPDLPSEVNQENQTSKRLLTQLLTTAVPDHCMPWSS